LRPRYLLTGLVLAPAVALGGLVHQSAASQSTPPDPGHAQVIAHAVIALDDDSRVWTVSTIEAGEHPTDVPIDDAPGFVLGADGAAVVRDGTGVRTRLAGGEALAVRRDDQLTVRATGADTASVSLLTLARAESNDLGAALGAGETFAFPGGSRDIELVGDCLTEGETTRIAASDAPILVLVTVGSVAVEMDADDAET